MISTCIYVYAHEMRISRSDKEKVQFNIASDGFVNTKMCACKRQCPRVYNENCKLIYLYLMSLRIFGKS